MQALILSHNAIICCWYVIMYVKKSVSVIIHTRSHYTVVHLLFSCPHCSLWNIVAFQFIQNYWTLSSFAPGPLMPAFVPRWPLANLSDLKGDNIWNTRLSICQPNEKLFLFISLITAIKFPIFKLAWWMVIGRRVWSAGIYVKNSSLDVVLTYPIVLSLVCESFAICKETW